MSLKFLSRISLAFLIMICAVGFTNAQDEDKFFITFYGTDGGNVGHAFVAFGMELAHPGLSVDEGAWGQYPETSLSGGASLLIGNVPGKVKNDAEELRSNNSVNGIQVEVSKSEYSACKEVLANWTNKGDYKLVFNDCVSFIIDVGNQIESLKMPNRITNVMPVDYILKLIEDNPQ